MDTENLSTDTTPETSTDTIVETTTPTNVETVATEPEWTPNYKYKAYGKELEVDEWARPLINKDNQEHLIKLYEKSGGFDHLKTNFKELEQKHSHAENNFNQLNQVRNTIMSNIDKGDLGKAFGVIGLTDDQVFNYVKQKLEYSQLPADQRQIVDHYRTNIESRQQAESMLEQQKRMTEDFMMQKHEFELDRTFSNPKFAPIITDYNTRVGDENGFRNVIQQIGATEFYTTGKNLPVAEATERAIKMLALNNSNETLNQVAQVSNTQTIPTQSTPAPKPIMRVGKGGGVSPIAQQPRSISDLKKLYNENYGA